MKKINVWPIVKAHIETLHHYHTSKLLKRDLCLFYILPLIFGIVTVLVAGAVPDRLTDSALISLTIIIPLLLNLLFVIYDVQEKRSKAEDKQKEPTKKESKTRRLREHVFRNISYTILVAFLAIILFAFEKWVNFPKPEDFQKALECASEQHEQWLVQSRQWFGVFLSTLCYFSIYHIGVTSLMIVKRVHTLLFVEFNPDDDSTSDESP